MLEELTKATQSLLGDYRHTSLCHMCHKIWVVSAAIFQLFMQSLHTSYCFS